ncbi:flagellar motor switch protein FliN/FliY [Phyllobacterium sp. YR620]|jgi:flagellar motor switch protein FliN/FliY|uniref:Flagellar motor switch protein FliN n=1 Tax=Phyllobacterium pellucidum TaxID=2740464 RepID=A0A849VUJ6_9HYPH|nr:MULTISPECIES: flagellar motor switch protein FliN [Phyllobacterium]NTS33651.1 flagellar motor switch protein FliN [Phyllobacterium pellucidum]SDO89555.1 flagellar motor switch protein FliN/FliY [Phyllobacterium sp. YR620]SFJ49330.1 flagellar motor switch protein FliN/FliY [Phyllobacterium sp. CL33Tsu]
MAPHDRNSIEDELNEAIEELKRDDSQPRKQAGAKPNIDLIMGIPVDVQVVLGSTSMPVANLMKLGRGAVVTLDKQIGDPVDIVVNGRVIARGEVIVLEDDSSRFGVSLTEVIGSGA